MKKIAFFLLVLASIVACKNRIAKTNEPKASKTESKSIEYEINRNIITFRIAYNLIKENRQWPTRPNPVRDDLLGAFSEFENHEVLKLIKETGGDDAISLFLLHKKEFPAFGNKFAVSKKNKEYELNDSTEIGLDPKWNLLYKSLYDFYLNANVEAFIQEHEYYYEGAIKEISEIAHDIDFVGKMEEYTNQINDRYVISPEPLFITGGWRGIGPNVKTDEISIAYQFISPSDKIDLSSFATDSINQFGYRDKEFIRNLCVHEFGHSFVNPSFYNQEISDYIKVHESQLSKELEETIQQEGIGSFTVYLIEHVVRLLEIRIASIYFGNEEAQKIRDENVGFVFLAEMEKVLIEKFEKRKDHNSTYADFIPELLKVLEK